MPVLLFDVEKLAAGTGGKALGELKKAFNRAGANVAQASVGAMKRTSGMSYTPVALMFVDSQNIELRITKTGDIFQVAVNGKIQPLKNHDDWRKAVGELAKILESGRSKFQAAQAKALTVIPKGIKSAAPKMMEALTAKASELDGDIADARTTIETLRAGLALDSAIHGEDDDLCAPSGAI